MKKRKEFIAASLLIRNASKMTEKGKNEIAIWLRDSAKFLLKDGKNFGKQFRAKYILFKQGWF